MFSIFKLGKRRGQNNFRRMCITGTISRLKEKVVWNRLRKKSEGGYI